MESEANATEVSLILLNFLRDELFSFIGTADWFLNVGMSSCGLELTTLGSHLDAVRAIAFHPNELSLASGGDDNTVKIWRVDINSLATTS